MPFQFYCPQGHLLMGDEAHQGQQSQCPHCGATFMIPIVQPQAGPAPGPQFPPGQPFPGGPQFGPAPGQQPFPGQGPMIPDVTGGAQFANIAAGAAAPPPQEVAAVPPAEAPKPEPQKPPEPRIFRIHCPQNHVLETPSDMLGQQAMCPYCNTQFELRYEDSIEYQEELVEKKKLREVELNKQWVTWSIRAAIGVGVMIFLMICYAVYSAFSEAPPS